MKLFQINQDDLETLESELPLLMDSASASPDWNDRKDVREAWEMVQKIIGRVRWNYGPPSEVERID